MAVPRIFLRRTCARWGRVGRFNPRERLFSISSRIRQEYISRWDQEYNDSIEDPGWQGFSSRRLRLRLPSKKEQDDHDVHYVTVQLDDGKFSFDPAFLRDSCTCPRCVDPSSKQKFFETAQIPSTIKANIKTITPTVLDGSGPAFEITWENDVPGYPDDHTTHISANFLHGSKRASRETRYIRGPYSPPRRFWDSELIAKENLWVDYSAYMNDDDTLHLVLQHLHTHGLAFIRGVPDNERELEDAIAPRIGPLKRSFYGDTWNVRSVPDAKNIAYTNKYLGLHMDLLYVTNPPHLQFLHSLRARASGGESMFSDSFFTARQLLQSDRDRFDALRSYPVLYRYHNDGQYYENVRPVIETAQTLPFKRRIKTPDISPADITRVNWSPPFQGPNNHGAVKTIQDLSNKKKRLYRRYLDAAAEFSRLVNDPRNMFSYRMKEGECVIFDNRRVLHARREFDVNSGERWLKGCYIDDEVYYSRLETLRVAQLQKAGN